MTLQNAQSVPQQFVFENRYPVRVIDRDGEPWFVAADVCAVLELSNVSMAVGRLDEDEKATISLTDSGGRPYKQLLVNEPGLYTLVLRSDKPAAKEFKRWITHEVIPAIRKTGQYAARKMTGAETVLAMAQQLVEQERMLFDHEGRIGTLEAITKTNEEYCTVKGFYSARKLGKISEQESAAVSRRAKALSEERGLPIKKVPDMKWGDLNAYHVSVLEEVTGWNKRLN